VQSDFVWKFEKPGAPLHSMDGACRMFRENSVTTLFTEHACDLIGG
jgi:hypothetical protein